MSSNLYKGRYTNIQKTAKRVIDTNDLVEKRIEELSVKMRLPENEGFVTGLDAPEVGVDALFAGDDEEAKQRNIVKANEEAENILKKARQDAGVIYSTAKAEADRYAADTKAAAEQESREMLISSREQGYEEGLRRAEKEIQKHHKQLEEREKELDQMYQNQLEELEPKFIDMLSGIYEHVFQVDLSSYREILIYLISSTMRKIEGVRSYMIHVSEEDYPYVSMQKKQFMSSVAAPDSVVEVIEDISLSKNECMIETDSGIFDCGLGTQLSELSQKLKLLSYERTEK